MCVPLSYNGRGRTVAILKLYSAVFVADGQAEKLIETINAVAETFFSTKRMEKLAFQMSDCRRFFWLFGSFLTFCLSASG